MATPEQRAAWKEADQALRLVNAERERLLQPTDERHAAAQEALAVIEEEAGTFLAHCEGCGEPIFEGEPMLGGETPLCRNCAPTYADLLSSNSFVDADGEPLTADERRVIYDSHINAGGKPTDSMAGP